MNLRLKGKFLIPLYVPGGQQTASMKQALRYRPWNE